LDAEENGDFIQPREKGSASFQRAQKYQSDKGKALVSRKLSHITSTHMLTAVEALGTAELRDELPEKGGAQMDHRDVSLQLQTYQSDKGKVLVLGKLAHATSAHMLTHDRSIGNSRTPRRIAEAC
jgi:hypothetical protein